MNKKLQKLLVLPVFILMLAACGDKKEENKAGDGKKNEGNATGEDIAKGKESFRAVYAAIQSGDLSRIGDHIDSNVVEHDPMLPGGSTTGIEATRKSMTSFKQAFPDLKLEVINIVGEGDMMYAMVRMTGTNTGPLDGMPATNKKVDALAVDVVKLKNGQAIEHWAFNDNVTLMRQLGLMPPPPPAK